MLEAAHALDLVGNKAARGKIAAAKALAPSAVIAILDRAIQVGGGRFAHCCVFFPEAVAKALVPSTLLAILTTPAPETISTLYEPGHALALLCWALLGQRWRTHLAPAAQAPPFFT